VNWALGRFFRAFNRVLDGATQAYRQTVGWCLRLSGIVLLQQVPGGADAPSRAHAVAMPVALATANGEGGI
jgi:hypothetical protein